VGVGAHQVGQQLGVSGIGLGPRGRVAIAVAADRQRVDAVDRIAGPHQRVDHQAAVDLDADDHLLGRFGVLGHKPMQPGKAGHPDPEAPPAEHRSCLVHHQHVVVGLGPIDAHEDHRCPPQIDCASSPRGRGDRMDQCSWHAIPPAVSPSPTGGGTL